MNPDPQLAVWLLGDARFSEDPDVVFATAEQSLHTLCTPLAELVTAHGCQALVRRAIHLATVEYPFLSGLHAGLMPGPCLEGMLAREQGVALDQMKAGLVAVASELVGLLERFIGADLTSQLVGQEVMS